MPKVRIFPCEGPETSTRFDGCVAWCPGRSRSAAGDQGLDAKSDSIGGAPYLLAGRGGGWLAVSPMDQEAIHGL